MTTALASPRAFAVWFKDLDRWDVAYFRRIQWAWPVSVLRPLGQVLIRQVREVDAKADKVAVPIIEKISFGGEVSLSAPANRAKYKGRLFWAEAGELVYSKIRVKQGSLAVVPHSMPRLAVSAEYPIYGVKPGVAASEYLVLVLKSRAFQSFLDGLSHGGSTKTRLHPTEFERLTVPLPSLPVQRAIVRRWQEGQDAVEKARQAVARIEKDSLTGFFKALGLEPPKAADTPKAFAVWWKDFLRWSVSYNQAALNIIDLARGRYPVVNLGSVLSLVQYGTSEKAKPNGVGTPVLRINNIKDGVIDVSDLKHIALTKKGLATLVLANDDILIIRTSGSRDLVGTCGVFHVEGEYVFASYLIRLRALAEKANADFLAHFLNSPVGRQQINAISRQIMQNNINSEELRHIQVCLPPPAVQRGIADMVAQKRAEVARERQAAAKLSAEVTQEVEEMILGTRPVKVGGG